MRVVASEGMQVGPGEAAPRGAQDGEPMHAVGAVQQGAGEADEVGNDLALGQGFDVHGLEAQLLLGQLGHQGVQMGAGAHQHANGAIRLLLLRLADEVDDVKRFAAGIRVKRFGGIGGINTVVGVGCIVGSGCVGVAFEEGVHLHACCGHSAACGVRGFEANRALVRVVGARKDVLERLVDPADHGGVGAVVAVELQWGEAHGT